MLSQPRQAHHHPLSSSAFLLIGYMCRFKPCTCRVSCRPLEISFQVPQSTPAPEALPHSDMCLCCCDSWCKKLPAYACWETTAGEPVKTWELCSESVCVSLDKSNLNGVLHLCCTFRCLTEKLLCLPTHKDWVEDVHTNQVNLTMLALSGAALAGEQSVCPATRKQVQVACTTSTKRSRNPFR